MLILDERLQHWREVGHMKARAILPGNRGHHAIQVYVGDDTLGEAITDFLADGVVAAQPTIVIATCARCDLIVNALRARRFDLAMLLETRTLLLLDADETLGQFMVNDRLDAAHFKEVVGLMLGRVARPEDDPIVRVYAELVDVLWRGGSLDAALRLEVLWNELMQSYSFSLMCGCALTDFLRHPAQDQVCACHTHVHLPAVA
jgi:hypothetical protein